MSQDGVSDSAGNEAGLSQYLAGQPDVSVAFLFGSHARGRAGPLSDVDIAVWLDDRLSAAERGRRRAEILAECMARLGTNDVDVVVLNDAPPVLAYEVARDGVVLWSRSPELPAGFRARAFKRYLDTEHMRRVLAGYLEQRVRENRIGQPAQYRRVDGSE